MSGLVVILMGSPADQGHADQIAQVVHSFGVEVQQRIGSAHKTPEHVLELLRFYDADTRPKVFVTVAGRSNALSAFCDTVVTAPVIACPPPSDAFGGADLYSSLRMPSGVAPLVVLDPANAALAAVKILGVADPGLRERIRHHQHQAADAVVAADRSLHMAGDEDVDGG